MLIQIENIGKVHNASIEIDGITVIAGENNTGKSTVGRVLFTIFNRFCNVEEMLLGEREDSIFRSLWELEPVDVYGSEFQIEASTIAHNAIDAYRNPDASTEQIITSVHEQLVALHQNDAYNIDEDDMKIAIDRIRNALNTPQSDLLRRMISEGMRKEFNGQINNVFSNDAATIRLDIKNANVLLQISDNSVTSMEGMLKLNTKAVYLDDEAMSGLDLPLLFVRRDERTRMIYSVLSSSSEDEDQPNLLDSMIAEDKLRPIIEKLNQVAQGDLSMPSPRRSISYRMPGTNKGIDIGNLSSGLKIFAVLKLLLLNGEVRNKGLIILDEPEIHLHPEWQIIFAELLVMLQKAFDLHILLTTHSPYFLQALEVYSRVHEMSSRCKYYQAEQSGTMAEMHDVSNDVERIYKTLAAPFQTLEDAAYGVDC